MTLHSMYAKESLFILLAYMTSDKAGLLVHSSLRYLHFTSHFCVMLSVHNVSFPCVF